LISNHPSVVTTVSIFIRGITVKYSMAQVLVILISPR
jgi:hypothetical protein